MGSSESIPLAATSADFHYFCLTFRTPDKINLIHANQEIMQIVRSAIQHNWTADIQKETDTLAMKQLQVHGNPFCLTTSRDEALQSKRMCCEMLVRLKQAGWLVDVSTDLTQTQDLTSWFLRSEGHMHESNVKTDYPWSAAASPVSSWHAAHG